MQNQPGGDEIAQNDVQDNTTEVAELPAIPSFSFENANCVLDIEIQADQLLAYIDRLTSLADRACDSAMRQTETAQLLERSRSGELHRLRDQLEQQRNAYQEQQLSLVRLEHESKARVTALESRLHDLERQTRNTDLEAQLLRLKEENAALAAQLASASAGNERGKHDSKPVPSPQPTSAKSAVADEFLESQSRLLRELEAESRAKVAALEERLATVEADLQAQEGKLKEKDSLIQLAAAKERELGNLIQRLSAECASLTAELEEKSRPQAVPSEASKTKPVTEEKIWNRVIRRLQHEIS